MSLSHSPIVANAGSSILRLLLGLEVMAGVESVPGLLVLTVLAGEPECGYVVRSGGVVISLKMCK